jgi:hypothetical protein
MAVLQQTECVQLPVVRIPKLVKDRHSASSHLPSVLSPRRYVAALNTRFWLFCRGFRLFPGGGARSCDPQAAWENLSTWFPHAVHPAAGSRSPENSKTSLAKNTHVPNDTAWCWRARFCQAGRKKVSSLTPFVPALPSALPRRGSRTDRARPAGQSDREGEFAGHEEAPRLMIPTRFSTLARTQDLSALSRL